MNPPIATDFTNGLALDLQAFRALGEEILGLVTRESQALSNQNDYQPGEFNQTRAQQVVGIN